MFAEILEKCDIVTTPGSGFGPGGEPRAAVLSLLLLLESCCWGLLEPICASGALWLGRLPSQPRTSIAGPQREPAPPTAPLRLPAARARCPAGEGFVRASAFGHRDNILEAVERFKKVYGGKK